MNDAGTQQVNDAVFLVTIRLQCRNAHQWDAALPKYWFNISDMRCSECGEKASSGKAGELRRLK
jgi:hypothetical protein